MTSPGVCSCGERLPPTWAPSHVCTRPPFGFAPWRADAWEQPPAVHGTPTVTLGFTRDELDAMEAVAWPSSVETWIHEQITAALEANP